MAKTNQTATARETSVSDPYDWIATQTDIKTSADIEVPTKLIDQVIGQEQAVAVAEKAASQKRHLLLIGDPGTGKSMIAKAMSEMLPPVKLNDVMVHHNKKDPNQPVVATVPAGQGRQVQSRTRRIAMRKKVAWLIVEWTSILLCFGLGAYFFWKDQEVIPLGMMMLVGIFLFIVFRQKKDPVMFQVPKLLLEYDPSKENHTSYVEATGSHNGALLGDVRHDPFQSGGLETPTHERVEVGAIHRAHKGILFIDEINVLRLDSQQALLTAMQDRKFAIVGQSETSSGAMVRTAAVPCDFILVAAGNLDAVQPPDGHNKGMHPALRSRIRGYGYEVYVNSSMPDTHENRLKLCRFVAQEVVRDGRVPHLDREAIAEVILEGQRRSGHRGKLTLRLRELGGLVRTAGDIAVQAGRELVTADDVRKAKSLSRSLEQQIAEQVLEVRRETASVRPVGNVIGVASGAGIVGTGEVGEPAGLVVPISSTVTPPLNRNRGQILFGGGIQESARAETEMVAALLKTLGGDRISGQDLHLHSLVAQDGVDASTCGLALAVSALSALEGIPVRQDTILLGGVSTTGDLLAVRGVTQAIESAVDAGYTRAILPEANRNDVLLNPVYKERVTLVHAEDLAGALPHALASPTAPALAQKVRTLLGRNGHEKAVVARVANRR